VKTPAAFYVFIVVWLVMSFILFREELGILHVGGLLPITTNSLHDNLLFGDILAAGPAFSAWWAVHVYRRKYGDLKGKYDRLGKNK